MWWPRGRRCWWYMYPPYLPYAQAPQQSLQTAQQPTQQPIAPFYPPAPFVPPPPTPDQEIEMLESYKVDLEEELRGVEARIKELRDSIQEPSDEPSESEK